MDIMYRYFYKSITASRLTARGIGHGRVDLEREARWSTTPLADKLEYILQFVTVCGLQQYSQT